MNMRFCSCLLIAVNHSYRSETAMPGKALAAAIKSALTSTLVAGILVSGSAFAFSGEKLNEMYGRYIIVADITPPPKPGSIDRAKATPRMGGEGGQLAGAAASGGASLGAAAGLGLLAEILLTPNTHDSRNHMYLAIGEKECKVTRAVARSHKADISKLVPGQFAQWTGPPSDEFPNFEAIKDARGKPVLRIDASHSCFAAYQAAIKDHAEKAAAVEQH